MQKLSKYSFGAYLVHALLIEQLDNRAGLNMLSFNPVLSVVGIGGCVYFIFWDFGNIKSNTCCKKVYGLAVKRLLVWRRRAFEN